MITVIWSAVAPSYRFQTRRSRAPRAPKAVAGRYRTPKQLIVSLRPNKAKDELTSACLRNVYGLSSMPEDPQNPARLCNPDSYTHMYLSKLTPVLELHDSAWWDAWWAKNRDALESGTPRREVSARSPAS